MNSKFTVQYFIDKFTAIPDELWCINRYTDGNLHCALGHCGVRIRYGSLVSSEEGRALEKLVHKHFVPVSDINDGKHPDFQQPTPKARILAALHKIKSLESGNTI